MKTIAQIFKNIPGTTICGNENLPVPALCTDSRRAIPGSLFFAVDGLHTAGTDYIASALKNGAAAIAVSKNSLHKIDKNISATLVVIEDVLKTIPIAASQFFNDSTPTDFPLVGITGTNGKTSISSIVRYLMMQQTKRPWGLIGTVRYELGKRSIPSYKTTPEALDLAQYFYEMRRDNCAGAIMEVSSHSICQNRVYGLKFDVVAFSNLTQDHIDYHGDMENYFLAKKRLFDGNQGAFPQIAVINTDDPYGERLKKEIRQNPTKVVSVGQNQNCDFCAQKILFSAAGTRFVLRCPSGEYDVRTRLPGLYNVSNVLCALAIVDALGLQISKAIADLEKFPGVPGRMERINENDFPFEIFVDYAHTDDALCNALSMLKSIAKAKLLCVFGCGGNRDRDKRPKMVKAVQKFADHAWATADNPRKESLEQIFNDMKTGVQNPETITFEPDRRRAIALAIDAAQKDDIILIAGKGHENYQIFANITLPFDDKIVAKELLELKRHRKK
ncbi:MAG: UDP-N-acetylmuramoyl-L-alanyl-D-glutamate--2,6-diaminopimelate ligase [Opitutales bacterium]|nr:UDP-N-acetylmuramoyl-L-alanyl-D-glutamate--2,6-diaminopimelate ligase [Opitutales bacterium]